MAKGELPRPVNTLLAYAADGWAIEHGRLKPSGKPKAPDLAEWGPVARTLLQKPDGLDRLRDLALAGMVAWNVDPSIMACVAPAFATPGFAVRLARRVGRFVEPGPRPGPSPAAEPSGSIMAPKAQPPTHSITPQGKPLAPRPRKP